jgi:AraC-like DNA-binding protein
MDIPHAYGAHTEDPWSIQWAHFGGDEVDTFLAWLNITPKNPLLSVGENLQIIRLFNEILAYCQLGYSLSFLLNSATLLRQIMSLLVLHQNGSITNNQELDVAESIQFMLLNLAHKLTVQQLAAQTNLSPSHFSRQFQRQTGYAPIDYFIRLKMQKACELLSVTNLQIQEIAQTIGYGDPYYFSRLFKQVLGVSPRTYRDTNRFVV